jgi:hypothetical protein
MFSREGLTLVYLGEKKKAKVEYSIEGVKMHYDLERQQGTLVTKSQLVTQKYIPG